MKDYLKKNMDKEQYKIYSRPRIKVPKIIVNRKNRKNNKSMKIFIISIISISTVKIVLDAIFPIFDELCEEEAKSIATIVSNEEVTSIMKDYNYDELFTIEKDNEGNIVMIKTNSSIINEIISDIAINIQVSLNKRGSDNIEIALGSFSGFKLLAGKGPRIPIKISMKGNVGTHLKSEFVEEGINQTLHKIYLIIDCQVSILNPYESITKEIQNQVLLSENIILGRVPETYYNINTENLDEDMEVIE